jgi:hypothetical protein
VGAAVVAVDLRRAAVTDAGELAAENERLKGAAFRLGVELSYARGDVLALKRAVREAEADRDALRRMLAEVLAAWRVGRVAPPDELGRRAAALLGARPYEEAPDGDG